MHAVERFLQNGTLPFIGREVECDRIVELWRGSVDAGRLRGMMLTAEAGAGKSRLLEEAIARVRQEGGVVVHAKLYPEATNDLGQVIRGAFGRDPSLGLQSEGSDNGIAGVVTLLSRLSRLRRTLFILEDIHLLPPEAYPDLDALIRGLSDETLSFLAATRPVQRASHGILEPFLVAHSDLAGLSVEEIARLWREVFGSEIPHDALLLLERETLGLPLALRSALRGALRSEAIRKHRGSDTWRLGVSTPLFESSIHQSVSVIVEGLVAGLSPEMRRSIASISTLGEVVARESAEALIGSVEVIDDLLDANLLVQASHPVAPLAGTAEQNTSSGPSFPTTRFPLLAFTHSLVQNQLCSEARGSAKDLIAVIGQNLPLYSLTPFSVLDGLSIPAEIEGEELARAVRRSTNVAQVLDRTSNWREGVRLWTIIRRLIDHLEEKIDDDELIYIRVRRAVDSLSLLGRRQMGSEAWTEALEEAEALTASVNDPRLLYGRIFIACHRLAHYGRQSNPYEVLTRTDEMVDGVLSGHPEFRTTPAYSFYLDAVGTVGLNTGSKGVLRNLEERIDDLLHAADLSEEVRSLTIRRPTKYLLYLFDTPEELRKRFDLLETIEGEFAVHLDQDESYFEVTKAEFFLQAGEFAKAAEITRRVIPIRKDLGLWMSVLLCHAIELTASSALDYRPKEVVETWTELMRGLSSDEQRVTALTTLYNNVRNIALYRGDLDLLRQTLEAVGQTSEEIAAREEGVVAIWREEESQIRRLLQRERPPEYSQITRAVWQCWRALLEGEDVTLPEEKLISIDDILTHPHLRLNQLSEVEGTIHLLLMTGEIDRFREEGIAALERALGWLEEKGAPGYAPPLVELLRRLGAEEKSEAWNGRMNDLGSLNQPVTRERRGEEESGEKQRIRISMLGKIRIALPSEEYASVRGIRIRTILGLMVADEMLERSLSAQEFTHLAGGSDPDPEHARKKKNMGVVRLREIMGREAIVTDGDRPQLNHELVEVDLLEADRKMREAESALAEGSVVRALPLLNESLDTLDGEVPFPTLYDDFFEGVRSDVDRRLHTLLITTARALLDGGESTRAIDLIHRGVAMIPGDEELVELLEEARGQ